MNRFQTRDQNQERRGVVAVIVVVMLTTLLAFGALAVDVGYICSLTAEMQNTADAGALAGASAFKDAQWDAWHTRASSVISINQNLQGFQSMENQTIEVGRWDKETMTFTATDPADASSANAVRVVARRNDVSLFFAPLLGHNSTDVAREAVAMSSPSCNGIWGLNSVDIPGSVSIDSWDSTAGTYDAGSANDNGDVCSNGEIKVQGSADISGDVLSSTGDVTIIGGAATITGVTELLIDTVIAPPIDLSDPLANNDNATIGLTDQGRDPLDNSAVSNPGFFDLILLSGENLTLQPGTYIFDDIEMGGGSSLTLTGPTTIYLDDDFVMTGSSVMNTTQDPADLMIIMDGDSDDSHVKLTGNTEFYGQIYAPNSEITLSGTSDYYGAIIGRELDFNGNFSFHVDESLPLVNSLKGPVVLVK